MEDLYKKLKKQKENGKKLAWESITKEQLEELFYANLSDASIGELFNVTNNKVRYKRKKWGISIYTQAQKELLKSDLYQNLKKESKKRITSGENIEEIAKALTQYIFRNGPVEDMHTKGKLSQEDMKTLNKYMVNKIAGILEIIKEGDWLKLELLLEAYKNYGEDWEKVKPDTTEIDTLYKKAMGM